MFDIKSSHSRELNTEYYYYSTELRTFRKCITISRHSSTYQIKFEDGTTEMARDYELLYLDKVIKHENCGGVEILFPFLVNAAGIPIERLDEKAYCTTCKVYFNT